MGQLIVLGTPAPDFTALTQDEITICLYRLLNLGPVCLIFYPMDNTPVCTSQLCELRDNWDELQQRGVQVLGVNPSSIMKHKAFAQRHSFPFPLIHDEGSKIAKAYGAHLLLGLINRTVYLIGTDAKVLLAQRGKPSVQEILTALPQ